MKLTHSSELVSSACPGQSVELPYYEIRFNELILLFTCNKCLLQRLLAPGGKNVHRHDYYYSFKLLYICCKILLTLR